MVQRWTLPADLSAAAVARSHVGRAVAGWPNVDDVELVASELAVNAVDHGRPPVEFELDLVDGRLRLTVTSSSAAGHPERRFAEAHEQRGRGLALVDMLADRWGWHRDGVRLSVWAEFTGPADEGR